MEPKIEIGPLHITQGSYNTYFEYNIKKLKKQVDKLEKINAILIKKIDILKYTKFEF